MAPTKIFVGSLPEGTSTDDVRALFEAHGEVQECDVIKDYGFVHMANDADAQAAIAALNGHEFRGVAINVEQSRSRVRQKPGMGGKMTCFRCGKQGHWSKECRMGGGGGGPYGGVGYGGGGGFRGQGGGRPTPYDRRPPPAFERRGPPSNYEVQYDEAPYDRRRPYDRFDGNRGVGGGGGYDDYARGGAGGGFDRPEFDDRRMDYYARRSPPRDYYRPEPAYANGGLRGDNRRPPPYGAERFGGPPPGNRYGGRY
ncbi:RNA-binding protein lark [Galendromus occidentalis]|uniref:RNA-binding protein lark n=1 Tax=Galendromus occidentalis TaxID=34638 RepID=A0AAJ7WK33_9ACAR|nr:RNA-binding protein lark [Galendromus occidentalis]